MKAIINNIKLNNNINKHIENIVLIINNIEIEHIILILNKKISGEEKQEIYNIGKQIYNKYNIQVLYKDINNIDITYILTTNNIISIYKDNIY